MTTTPPAQDPRLPETFSLAVAELERIVIQLRDEQDQRAPWLVGTFLFWACSLDEGLRGSLGRSYLDSRSTSEPARSMLGLQYARNALVHGQLVCARFAEGLSYPLRYPLAYGEWRFVTREALAWSPWGTRHLPDQEASYDEHVSNHQVWGPLAETVQWFRLIERVLPDLPTTQT